MSETSRGILLGLVYFLEFLEFLTSPWVMVASLLIGLHRFGAPVIPDGSLGAIATISLPLIVGLWLLVPQQD